MVNYKIIASGYTAAISAFNFDSTTNKLSLLSTTPTSNTPSWLAPGPAPNTVFAALEIEKGGVETFTVDDEGKLTSVSQKQSGGIPVHLSVLSTGKEVVTANYDNGLVVSFPINDDGTTLGAGINGTTLKGSGPVKGRQDGPHAHQLVEYNDEILIADLGADMVWRLKKDDQDAWQLAGQIPQQPGSGPRHLVATEGNLFVVHELDNTLTQYTLPELPTTAPGPEPEKPEKPETPEEPEEPEEPEVKKVRVRSAKFRRQCNTKPPAVPTDGPGKPTTTDAPPTTTKSSDSNPTLTPPGPAKPPVDGEAELVDTQKLIPDNSPDGASWAAGEILLSQDSKFLYASNRNTGTTDKNGDPILIYSVNPFKHVDTVSTGLTLLRGMAIGGEQGEYLIAAGQKEGGIVIYSRGEDGKLTELDRYECEGSESITTFAWI